MRASSLSARPQDRQLDSTEPPALPPEAPGAAPEPPGAAPEPPGAAPEPPELRVYNVGFPVAVARLLAVRGVFMCVVREVVRVADDLRPIVRSADDRREIVGGPDHLPEGHTTLRLSRRSARVTTLRRRPPTPADAQPTPSRRPADA